MQTTKSAAINQAKTDDGGRGVRGVPGGPGFRGVQNFMTRLLIGSAARPSRTGVSPTVSRPYQSVKQDGEWGIADGRWRIVDGGLWMGIADMSGLQILIRGSEPANSFT